MTSKKHILAINGSASGRSSNERLIGRFVEAIGEVAEVPIWPDLKSLPHFDPELSAGDPPAEIRAFRAAVEEADAVLFCTPEYIFSIPAGVKNALEWCVATMIFTDKPVGIITASADGAKGHIELQMILRTLMAKLHEEAMLLISGIRGKIDENGVIADEKTRQAFDGFVDGFKRFFGD